MSHKNDKDTSKINEQPADAPQAEDILDDTVTDTDDANVSEDEADAMLQKIAKKYELLPSGGSDFHGANKPDIEMGIG